MIVSHTVIVWFCTLMVIGIGIGWGARDIFLLVKHLPNRAEWKDPGAWRDQIFGSLMGLILASCGIIGVIKYHLSH